MEEKEPELFKPITEPFTITIGSETVTWNPEYGDLVAPPTNEAANRLILNIDKAINLNGTNGYIDVSPTGPYLEATSSNPYAVVWAVNYLYGDLDSVSYGPGSPSLEDIGLGDENEYDSNGKPVVY